MLFDEQGLGKTITAIAAADSAGAESILVIAPAVVVHNWAREVRAWSPSRTVQVIRAGRDNLSPLTSVVIVSHTLFHSPRIYAQILNSQWDLCIVDEAHNFRNRDAKRTVALYGRFKAAKAETDLFEASAPGGDCVVNACDRVWALTGTPIPNNVSELWTHLRALFPESIPNETGSPMSFPAFRNRFCKLRPTRFGAKVVGNRNIDELKAVVRDVSLRRLKGDVLDLPAMRFETVSLQPMKVPWEFEQLAGEIRALIAAEDDPTAAEGFAALRSSAEFARFRRWCGLAKVDQAIELLNSELEFGALQKVVVFAWHTDVIDAIAEALRRYRPVAITGSTPPGQRTANVESFQRDPDVRVAVCNILAGGVGTTMTAASEAVFAEVSPVPGENAQAADRIHRIGQTERTRVRFLSLSGSIDEDLVGILIRKTRMIREALS